MAEAQNTTTVRLTDAGLEIELPPAIMESLRLTDGSTLRVRLQGDLLLLEPHNAPLGHDLEARRAELRRAIKAGRTNFDLDAD